MSFLKIIGARRRNSRVPTMERRQWAREQRLRADAGRCVECGRPNTGTHSYLCADCEDKSTLDQIREEIDSLRRRLLKGP